MHGMRQNVTAWMEQSLRVKVNVSQSEDNLDYCVRNQLPLAGSLAASGQQTPCKVHAYKAPSMSRQQLLHLEALAGVCQADLPTCCAKCCVSMRISAFDDLDPFCDRAHL